MSWKACAVSAVFAVVCLVAGPLFAAEPNRGGVLNVAMFPEPGTLVSGLTTRGSTQIVGGKIYEGLVTYDFDLNPEPWLAESWESSVDGLVHTFRLRQGVRWHDGQPFTADDVVFTFSEFLPEISSTARTTFANLESVLAINSHTVVFTFSKPLGPFMTSINKIYAPIMPAHIYRGTDFRNNPANATPVGTGPFKFDRWERGSFIRLVRNDGYWRADEPFLDGIVFLIIPDGASRATAIETGQVDVIRGGIMLDYFNMDRLRENPDIVVGKAGDELVNAIYMLWMNNRRPPFDDRRFRQALYYAIDRQFIVDNIYFGNTTAADGPIASFTPFHSDDVTRYDYDLDRARALLDEMGLVPDANGVRVTIDILPRSGEKDQRIAEYVRQQLSQIGVESNMAMVDRSTWAQRLGAFDFDLTFNLLSQVGDPALGVARTYYSTNQVEGSAFGNNAGYENLRVDRLFDRALATANPAERQSAYAEVQKILTEDVPVLWLVEERFPIVHTDRVENLLTSTYSIYDGWGTAYIDQ